MRFIAVNETPLIFRGQFLYLMRCAYVNCNEEVCLFPFSGEMLYVNSCHSGPLKKNYNLYSTHDNNLSVKSDLGSPVILVLRGLSKSKDFRKILHLKRSEYLSMLRVKARFLEVTNLVGRPSLEGSERTVPFYIIICSTYK